MSSQQRRLPGRLRLRGVVDGQPVLLLVRDGAQVLGSDRSADLRVLCPGVSRRHAKLHAGADGLSVEDLRSKNGTFVNGMRVHEARVDRGDWLQVGPVKLVLEEAEDAGLAFALDPLPSPGAGRGSVKRPTESCAEPHGEEPARWLELLERLLPEALGCAPDRGFEALEVLVGGLAASGALLAELPAGRSPLVLAAAGSLPDLAVLLPALPGPSGGLAGAEPSVVGSPTVTLSSAVREVAGANPLCLVVVGDFPQRERSAPLLRLVLELLLRGRAVATGPEPRRALQTAPRLRLPAGGVEWRSRGMRELDGQLRSLARSDIPVLIAGETGVGKEIVARTLHLSSSRREGPFVAINCAAIPAELLEAELFGVARGAATGVAERRGAFERARGGVLLLDEIGDMPIGLQAKLLRVLQEREVVPVGAEAARPVDVRLVSTTNTDIVAQMEGGSFRRDLYYRVAGACLQVPPLRQRREDIPRLVEVFLRRAVAATGRDVRGMTVPALAALAAAGWPGNVRQLEHIVHRAVTLCLDGQVIDCDLLPADVIPSPATAPREARPGSDLPLERQIELLEKSAVITALDRADGNRSLAARILGLSRNGLRKKIRRLGLDPG